LGKLIKKLTDFRYKGILAIVFVFALISAILFVELRGVQANYTSTALDMLPAEKIVTKADANQRLSRDVLIVWDSEKADSQAIFAEFEVILDDMKIGRDPIDLQTETLPSFEQYQTVVILMSDLSPLGEEVVDLADWVYRGGKAWFPMTIEKNAYSSVLENKLGILDSSADYSVVDSIYIDADFMVGGDKAYTIPDGFDAARTVQLASELVTVYARIGDETGLPLIWKTRYGEGVFVVDNLGYYEKAFRGFYAASYSLLEDVCVYPVINGSAFYLDDFPSQIPDGNSAYIQRDYNTTIRDFYVNIWWPDMMNLADRYGLKYTGLAIECYDDAVDGTTNAVPDTGTFLTFGNMLLRKGGEIGYHGYNHQPLCLDNCDYKGVYDYKTWESRDAMKQAFDELNSLCDNLFPDMQMTLYVPPSNLLSREGRAFLLKEYPQIKTISGIYFDDIGQGLDFSCVQEFDVSSDGTVDQPRIVSGCDLGDFMELAAVSELNFHFVNSHFTHPDDALDPERGAELGWDVLVDRFEGYLSWLYESAPCIRNLTGSELSAAVQRYAALSPEVELADDHMTITADHFHDEAHFIVRFNEKTPDTVSGGTLTHLTGGLYLLQAVESQITITFQ